MVKAIEQPGHIEERVVEPAQPDHGRDVVFGEHRDLGLGFVDFAQEFRVRRHEVLLNAGSRHLQRLAILVDQHRSRQITRCGTGRQHLEKRSEMPIVQWPGAGDIVGHSQNVAANKLRVFIRIGAGNGQGVLDRFARRT
jgi:hypothetical protein